MKKKLFKVMLILIVMLFMFIGCSTETETIFQKVTGTDKEQSMEINNILINNNIAVKEITVSENIITENMSPYLEAFDIKTENLEYILFLGKFDKKFITILDSNNYNIIDGKVNMEDIPKFFEMNESKIVKWY